MRKSLSAGVLLAVGLVIAAESEPGRVGSEARAARGSANGVAIDVDRRRGVTVRVTAPERRTIVRRGGQASVTCGLPGNSFPSVELDSASVEWPRGAASIRIGDLRRNYYFCSVVTRSTGALQSAVLADVAFRTAGRAMLAERETAAWVFANLQKVTTVNHESRNGRYPTADELRHVNYLPLATPADLPPPDAIGVYSSESERRLRVVKLGPSGAPVYVELDHDEFRTNVPHWMAWLVRR
jgi:hypothetical protein